MLILLTQFPAHSSEHYSIENIKDSENIGKVYKISKPVVYIEGLSHCNDLSKNIALNADCIVIKEARYKLKNLRPNCNNCIDKKRMPNPLKVRFKENLTLTVVGEYSSSINYLAYRIFGSKNIKFLLLKDQDGNLIEVMSSWMDFIDGKINYEEKRLIATKDFKHISKLLCFYPDHNKQDKVTNMINDFKLNSSIKIEHRDCKFSGTDKGVVIMTDNFDDFLTFNYFMGGWGIYGKWY